MSKNTSPWPILFSLCLYTFSITLTNIAIPPVLSIIIEELGISHAEAGLLMTTFCLPGIFLIIPLSFLSYRFKLKTMGYISLGFIMLGSFLVVISNFFPLMLIGRLVGGLGWSLLPVVGLQAIAKWFSGNRMSLAMGIYNTFVFLAIITALNSLGTVGLQWGWRSAIWITIGITAITLIVFAFLFKEPEIKTERPTASPRTFLKMSWPIWIIGLLWGLFSFDVASLSTFLPDFLYSSGFALGISGSMTSILIICTAVLSPFTGYILDKMKVKQILVVVGGIISSVFIFLLPINTGLVIPVLIIVGITTAPFVTVFMSVAPSMVKAEYVALAFGLITTFNTIGSFIGPYIFGSIRDVTQSYTWGFWMVAIVFLLIAALSSTIMIKEFRISRYGNEESRIN